MKILGDALAGFGYKAKRRKGEFGMEIETEVKNEGSYPVDFLVYEGNDPKGVSQFSTPLLPKWRAVGDGSLRNYGVEFIFKEPYVFKEALEAIDIFAENTKKIKFIQDAPATSVHVHINMWNETFMALGNFCTLYTLFENILTEFAGPMRRSNLFSLPTRCSETTGWNLIRMFEELEKGEYTAVRFVEEYVKYAALNLASLTRLGSLEVRTMRGTTDPKELKLWLTILNDLLVFSRTDGLNPREVISEYRVKNTDFFEEVFGKESAALYKVAGNIEKLIDKNLYFAGSIASSVKDWNTLGDNIAKKNEDSYTAAKKVIAKKQLMGGFDHPFDQAADVNIDAALGHMVNMMPDQVVNQPIGDIWAAPPVPPAPAAPQAMQWIDEVPADLPGDFWAPIPEPEPDFDEEF
jgi:hypothetical protein